MQKRKRWKMFSFRLTPDEADQLTKQVNAAGATSEFIRRAALANTNSDDGYGYRCLSCGAMWASNEPMSHTCLMGGRIERIPSGLHYA